MDAIWVNCNGGPYTIENPRGLSWGLQRGWGPMIDRLIPLSAGRMVVLHNPFGRSRHDTFMEFDQYWKCQRLAVTKSVAESFNENIKRLVSVADSVVVYIGAPHNSQRMKDMLGAASTIDNWQYHAWYNLQPIIDSGCSLAIDNMGKVELERYEIHWIESVQSLLVRNDKRVWMEATTEFNSPLHDRFPMLVTNQTFQVRHVLTNASSRFPNVAGDWYSQDVGVLLRESDYDAAGLDARLALLRSVGVIPVLQFTMVE